MWNFAEDMRRWDKIALEAHARHSRDNNTSYVRALSVVEAAAHRQVAQAAARHKRVIELGVGGGEHLAFASHTDRHDAYVGVDISFDFANICKMKFGIPVITADIAALPVAGASFDCAIAMNMLEHVQPLDAALSEVARVLVPEGVLYATVPTNGSLAVNFFKLVLTYPTMRAQGIKRPDLVWNYLNVNCFKRVRAALSDKFVVVRETAIPIPFLPWWASPMWVFHCVKR